MSDDALLRRIADAVLGPPDPERDRALEADLADRPELLDEFRQLREAWRDLADLPAREPPDGARERAEAAVLRALGRRVQRPAVGARDGAGASGAPGTVLSVADSRETKRARVGGRPAARAAAAVLLFLSGAAAGAWAWPRIGPSPAAGPGVAPDPGGPPGVGPAAPTTSSTADEPRFVLLIRGGDLPGNEEAAIREMEGWVTEIWSADRLVWADRFLPERAVWVGGERPASEEAQPVGGFFLIRAPDREEAVRIAGESPHLAWGGVVEVIPVARGPGASP